MQDRVVIVEMCSVDPITENMQLTNPYGGWVYDNDLTFEQLAMKSFDLLSDKVLEHTDTLIFSSLEFDPVAKEKLFRTADRPRPNTILNSLGVNLIVQMSAKFKKYVDSYSINYMCATGLKAMELASMIAREKNELVMIGCVDKRTIEIEIKCSQALRAVNHSESYLGPFDKGRKGFAVGASCSFIAICTEKKAKELGLEPIAIVEAIKSASKALSSTQPSDVQFINELVTSCISDIDRVGHWNAHATATPLGDDVEYDIFKSIVKNRDVPISSLKGRVGHCISNAALVEMIHGIKFFQQGKVFKTDLLYDKIADDDRIITEECSTDKDTFIKCSFGFAGKNSVAVIKCL